MSNWIEKRQAGTLASGETLAEAVSHRRLVRSSRFGQLLLVAKSLLLALM